MVVGSSFILLLVEILIMKYDEFELILGSLWKIKRSNDDFLKAVSSDVIRDNLELGTAHLDAIDEAIRSLEDNHKKMTHKYYSIFTR